MASSTMAAALTLGGLLIAACIWCQAQQSSPSGGATPPWVKKGEPWPAVATCNPAAQQLFAEAVEVIHGENPVHDWALARAKLEQAVQADPDCRRPAELLARKLSRDGAYREAIELLQKLWDSQPGDPWVALTMAWSLDYLGERDKAVEWYKQVGPTQPTQSSSDVTVTTPDGHTFPFRVTTATTGCSDTQRIAAAEGLKQPQRPKARPKVPDGAVELPHDGWSAQSSHEQFRPKYAIDGNNCSRWCTLADGQAPGMWFLIDLGKKVEVLSGIWLDDDCAGQSIYQNDSPRHCVVSLSEDGESWTQVAEWKWTPNHYMEAWWSPTTARFIRLEQKASNKPECWTIYEVHVFCSK